MKEHLKTILLWTMTALLLGGCVLALYLTGFFEAARSQDGIRAYIEGCAPWSQLAFWGIQLVSVVVAPIPSNITALAGAILFGAIPAFLLTWSAVTLGSVIVFFLARVLGQDFALRFVGQRLSAKYLDLIRRQRDTFLFLAFLFPFFPDDLLRILAGLPDLCWRRCLLLCVLARPWGLLAACAVGGSVLTIPLWAMAALGAAGGVLFVLALKYGDHLQDKLLERFKQ